MSCGKISVEQKFYEFYSKLTWNERENLRALIHANADLEDAIYPEEFNDPDDYDDDDYYEEESYDEQPTGEITHSVRKIEKP